MMGKRFQGGLTPNFFTTSGGYDRPHFEVSQLCDPALPNRAAFIGGLGL